jgi:ABC-type transport system involved in multi-copper enzyme maturation permease subunit
MNSPRNPLPALVRNELTKALRRKLPYFGFFALGLGCIVTYFIGGRLSAAATANAWGYLAFSMEVVSTDLVPIFVVVFSAMLLAEETGTGTIRAAVAAPVHRWELFLAKAAVGLGYTAALSGAAVVFSLGLAKVHYGFGPIGDSYGVVYSRATTLREFLLGYALSWLPLGALAMYGLLISTIVRTAGAAVAVGISTLFVIDFTKHLVGLDPYIFTRYIEYPWILLQQLAQGMDYRWRPEAWRLVALCGGSALVAFAGGLLVFVREDLNR